MKTLLATLLLLSGITTAADAKPAVGPKPGPTANEYVTQCRSRKASEVEACLWYARGIADGLTVWKITQPEAAVACIPEKVTSGQLAAAAVTFIEGKPQDSKHSAALLLTLAFVHNWPCEHGQGV